MAYRVSTKPDGEKRWWSDSDVIPDDHTDIRPATVAEAMVMEMIVTSEDMPPLALGEQIKALLAA